MNTFNGERKGFNQLFNKGSGRERRFVFKSSKVTKTRIFVNGGELVIRISQNPCIAGDASGRNVFYVNLNPLPGIKQFFVWFGDIFGVRRFNRYESKTTKNTPKRMDSAR